MRGIPSGGHSLAPSFRGKFAAVIARESGQSSIPETAVLERMGRSVLDRPVEPGDDGVKTSSASRTPHAGVVPPSSIA